MHHKKPTESALPVSCQSQWCVEYLLIQRQLGKLAQFHIQQNFSNTWGLELPSLIKSCIVKTVFTNDLVFTQESRNREIYSETSILWGLINDSTTGIRFSILTWVYATCMIFFFLVPFPLLNQIQNSSVSPGLWIPRFWQYLTLLHSEAHEVQGQQQLPVAATITIVIVTVRLMALFSHTPPSPSWLLRWLPFLICPSNTTGY